MRSLFLLLACLLPAPAAAEVKSASAGSFSLEHRASVRLPPAELFARFGQIGSWWDPQHSYSGQAGNLTLELKAGGCFCERLPNGGGIEHLRVVYVEPGKRIVLTGALGPLLFDAVHGVMDVQIRPSAAGSDLVLTYKAAGFAGGGADKVAPAVDRVLGEQVRRLATLR